MGNPHETEHFYESFRDYGQGEPRWPDSTVYDPAERPSEAPYDPRGRGDKCATTYVQKPAFQDAPFFSKPFVVMAENIAAPAGPVRVNISVFVADRQYAIFSCVGVDTDQPALLAARDVLFWFTVAGEIVPIFFDQSPPAAPGAIIQGQTTIMPGSVEQPFDLRACGVAFGVRGPAVVDFNVQNFNGAGVPILVRSLVSYWQYWLPQADEFQSAHCVE